VGSQGCVREAPPCAGICVALSTKVKPDISTKADADHVAYSARVTWRGRVQMLAAAEEGVSLELGPLALGSEAVGRLEAVGAVSSLPPEAPCCCCWWSSPSLPFAGESPLCLPSSALPSSSCSSPPPLALSGALCASCGLSATSGAFPAYLPGWFSSPSCLCVAAVLHVAGAMMLRRGGVLADAWPPRVFLQKMFEDLSIS
jgi:hypothetical protein